MKGLRRAVLASVAALMSTSLYGQSLEGTIDWNRRVAVGFGLSGQVAAVDVRPGDTILSGELMATLDTVPLKIALDKAANIAEIHQAQLEEQMAVLDRERTLYDEGALSGVQLEQVEIELSRRDYALKDAELAVQQARYQLDLAQLRAPFDAWIVESELTLGQFVNHESEDPPMITLAEKGRYLARTLIDAESLPAYESGTPVVIAIGDQQFVGLASRVGLEPVSTSGETLRYALAVEFSSDALIRPGTACTIALAEQ